MPMAPIEPDRQDTLGPASDHRAPRDRRCDVTREVVLGIDSSTQSTKVLAVDLETGEIVGEGRAPHSGGDIQDPNDWWLALRTATRAALADGLIVRGIAVAGQQHGCVTLDGSGVPVRPAPLWNNVASAPD